MPGRFALIALMVGKMFSITREKAIHYIGVKRFNTFSGIYLSSLINMII